MNEEEHERWMHSLSQRVRHDLPLTEAEWAAWRKWIASSSSSSAGKRRKKKKWKKKPLRALPFWQSLFCVLVSPVPAWVDSGYLLMRQLEAFPRLQVFYVVMDLGSWDDSRPCSASGCSGLFLVRLCIQVYASVYGAFSQYFTPFFTGLWSSEKFDFSGRRLHTVDTFHSSVCPGFPGEFHTFLREDGPWFLRSISPFVASSGEYKNVSLI